MITVDQSTTAAQLQHIIDTAPAGATIELGAGTFHFDQTVVINRDDITIVGQGAGQTMIEVGSGDAAYSAFQIGTPMDDSTYSKPVALTADASTGDTTLHLSSTAGLQAGDVLWIERPNTAAFLASIGDTQWDQSKPLQTSMVEIASISGDTVQLANGLAFDFDTSDATVEKISVAENVTLKDFSVDYGLTADPAAFTNVSPAFNRLAAISASATNDLHISGIDITNAPSVGFNFGQSINVNAQSLEVDGALDKGDEGNGYGVQLRAVYNSSFTDLSIFNTRHAVVFASWTSEAYNYVQVTSTNRDINFHGGLDHDNTVVVDSSERTDTEATYLSPSLFVNTAGTDYGAPTSATANNVTFGDVSATNKADVLTAWDQGSVIYARGGIDTITGGAGNDYIDAGTGNDIIYGSGGSDQILGQAGADTLIYSGSVHDYAFSTANGVTTVHKAGGGVDTVTGVETFTFSDGSFKPAQLPAGPHFVTGTSGNDTLQVTAATDVVTGNGGYDRVQSTVSYHLGDDVSALTLVGNAAISGTGNDHNNSILGNDAANTLSGLGGDDRIYGHNGDDHISGGDGSDLLSGENGNDTLTGDAGDDTLIGGAGNDSLDGGTGDDNLTGGTGNDTLDGGDGNDVLTGSAGADVFRFSAGIDTVTDFHLQQGDRIDFGSLDWASVHAALLAVSPTSADTLATLGIDALQIAGPDGPTLELRILEDGQVHELDLAGVSAHGLLASSDWMF